MKRILSVLLTVVFLFSFSSAFAASDTIDLLVTLMTNQLPEETDDFKVGLTYNADADAVVIEWTMKGFDSEDYISMASLVYKEASALFDSVADLTQIMKELLETSDCDQSVLGLITTQDNVPIAVFLNGAAIHIVK